MMVIIRLMGDGNERLSNIHEISVTFFYSMNELFHDDIMIIIILDIRL